MTPLVALEPAHLPRALELVRAAGLAGASVHLPTYLAAQPDGYLVALEDGRAIAVGGALRFGRCAFVGAMAVAPTHRRLGWGRRVLDAVLTSCRSAGVETFLLEATALGEPLYASCGFVVDDRTDVWTATLPAPAGPAPQPAVPLAPLDATATGTDRHVFLQLLSVPARGCLSEPDACALAQPGRVGPWHANSPAAAERAFTAVMGHARGPDGAVVAAARASNPAAGDILRKHGFTVARSLAHMRLGPPVSRRPGLLYGLATMGSG